MGMGERKMEMGKTNTNRQARERNSLLAFQREERKSEVRKGGEGGSMVEPSHAAMKLLCNLKALL